MIVPGLLSFTWSAVHAVIAAAGLLGTGIFWIFFKIHSRLADLEQSSGEREHIIYGSEDNPLHDGLTKEVAVLNEEVDKLREDLDDSSEDVEDLKERVERVEEKTESILEKLDG